MQKISIEKGQDAFLESWNKEFHKQYPLSKRMLQEYAIDSNYVLQDESYILFDKETYVGCIVVKTAENTLEKYQSVLFVSLIHVAPSYRNRGIATAMLKELEGKKASYHKKSLYLGGDMECFFPGVFVLDNPTTHNFFFAYGFKKVYKSYNLWTNQQRKISFKHPDITFHVAKTKNEKNEILKCIKSNFSYRWYLDAKDHSTSGFVYATLDNQVVGFVKCAKLEDKKLSNGLNTYLRYQNLAAIGPLGVIEAVRSKQIGKSLVMFAVDYLFTCGASDVIVDWTGLIEFYQKCGFTSICDTFMLYEK